MKRKHLVVLMVVMLAAMGSAGKALADAAPPPPPPAGSVENGEYPTMVQMESENVIMTIADDIAYVKATFNMRNQGTEDEAFDVRFPVDTQTYGADGPELWSVYNFAAYVDGKPAEVVYVSYPDPIYNSCEGCPDLHWATWHVTFPAGLPVTLGVIYQVDPYYWSGGAFQNYFYILETGAGWYGPIGEGTITVRLPYEVDTTNTVYAVAPSGYMVSGTDIAWHFTDLEPTEEDNVRVEILSPRTLRDIQSAQRQVDENPDSVDAHLKLARALAGALSFKYGLNHVGNSDEMAAQARAAYERSLELAPHNVDIYIEYLELLWDLPNPKDPLPDQLLPILERALELDPNNERLVEMRDWYNDYLDYATANPGWFNNWPTSTPGGPTRTPRPTRTPGPTTTQFVPSLTPTSTLAVTLTPTPIPTPLTPSDTTPPLTLWVAIGAAVIGGAAAGVWVYRKRRVA